MSYFEVLLVSYYYLTITLINDYPSHVCASSRTCLICNAAILVPQTVMQYLRLTSLIFFAEGRNIVHLSGQSRRVCTLICNCALLLLLQRPFHTCILLSRYCERISTLIQSGTDEWQSLWQQAIKELFHNSEIFQNPVNNINAINSLLKVIEKAFKVSIRFPHT